MRTRFALSRKSAKPSNRGCSKRIEGEDTRTPTKNHRSRPVRFGACREPPVQIDVLRRDGLPIASETAPIGGAGYDAPGKPLPDATLSLARRADAVVLGAVGGPRYDALPREFRPEQGLLAI